jgi:hypothetical protein
LPRKSGRFIQGYSYSPHTLFKPGERRGVSTEFKPGQPAPNKMPIGSVKIRRETHTGLLRVWVKIEEPNIWKKRAVLVWESIHGSLPKGWVVHHDNRDSLNDSLENLIGMSRRDHAAEHREELQLWRQ